MGLIKTPAPVRAALYARVSSDKQAQAQTIASQVEALQERMRQEELLPRIKGTRSIFQENPCRKNGRQRLRRRD